MGMLTSTDGIKPMSEGEQHPYGLALYVPFQCVSKLFPKSLSKIHDILLNMLYFMLMLSCFSQ